MFLLLHMIGLNDKKNWATTLIGNSPFFTYKTVHSGYSISCFIHKKTIVASPFLSNFGLLLVTFEVTIWVTTPRKPSILAIL